MALYDLADRLNWQQACEILGCSKTHLYRLVRAGKMPIYGIGKRYRWFHRTDCEALLQGGNSVSKGLAPAERQNRTERE